MLTDGVREALRTGQFEQLDLGALYLETLDASGASACAPVVPQPPTRPFLGAPTLDLTGFAVECRTPLTDALRMRGTSRVFSGTALDTARFATPAAARDGGNR